MRFLLTNDDGITAPGLAALATALSQFAALTIVAPDQHLSGCSHQVNAGPFDLQRHDENRHSLDGSPADCARVGLLHVDPDTDWVMSGVNAGGNLGVDVFMSGTVAAVREAAFLGKPGIAFSQYHRDGQPIDWTRTAQWTVRVAEQLVEQSLSPGAFWNVNFPDPVDDREPEVVYCNLDHTPHPLRFELKEAQLHYQCDYHQRERTPGKDVAVCFGGDIAVTRIDLAT